jgi:hypothetical protein
MMKSDMLSGKTAEQLGRPLRPLGGTTLFLGFFAGAAYFVSGTTAETAELWMYILLALPVVMLLIAWGFAVVAVVKGEREQKAGYTTTGGAYPHVPQVDSKTGEVLREVGQPLISPQRSWGHRRLR